MIRIFFIFILLKLLLIPAFSQPEIISITIHEPNIKVENLLKKISLQSGMNFSYNPHSFDTDKKISFHINNGGIDETLKKLC